MRQRLRELAAGGVLGNSAFRSYWLVGLVSNFGWLIQMVGASWLMLSLGGSATMVALVQTALALPVMLFSLPADALADAFGRRTLVLWAQGFLAIVTAVLVIFSGAGALSPWSLLLFTFLVGAGRATSNPAWQTRVSELVPREHLGGAIALNSISFNLARSLGPALGGLVVALLGAFAAFATTLVSSLLVFAYARRWERQEPREQAPREPLFAAMRTGLRYVFTTPATRRILSLTLPFNSAGIATMALLPLIAHQGLGGSVRLYGVLLGAFGSGAIVGAMGLGRLRRARSRDRIVPLAIGLATIGTLGLATGGSLITTSFSVALVGAGWVMTLSTFGSLIQIIAPRSVLSRSQAIYQSSVFGANALGSWLWGMIAERLGLQEALALSGVALAVVLLVAWFRPLKMM